MLTDLQMLQELQDGEVCYLNWFEESGGEVERHGDIYFLSEIPQYGGEPRPYGKFNVDQFDEIIKIVSEWT